MELETKHDHLPSESSHPTIAGGVAAETARPSHLRGPTTPEHRRPTTRALVAVPSPEPDTRLPGWRRLARRGLPLLLPGLDLLAVGAGFVGTALAASRPAPTGEMLLFGGILLTLLWLGGNYRARLAPSVLDDLPAVAGRCVAAAALTVLAQPAGTTTDSAGFLLEGEFLLGAVSTSAAVLVLRGGGYAVVRRMRAHGIATARTLIVGAGRVGVQVAHVLRSHTEYGLRPVGFLDAEPCEVDGSRPLPVLGAPDQLPHMLQRGGVSAVVVAFSSMKESEMVSLIRTCDRFSCELFVVPRLFELHHVDASMDTAWGFPLVRLRRATYRSWAWRLKRVVDVLVAGLLLLVAAPAMLLIALAVRLDGGPGVLFGQERVGVDGHHFSVLKFRSLRPASAAESATAWNVADDPRLTRLGRFLRATSLDELPQLFNILRGDMSLVGPRPERPHFVSQFRALYPSYEARHRVPSGLTGWAQVHGLRGDTSIADRARFDNYYIENWSLWLDLKIILRTVGAVVRAAGR